MENEMMENRKMKKIIIPLGIGILVLIILVILFSFKKDAENANTDQATELPYGNEYFEIDIDDPAFDASTPIESGDFEQFEIEVEGLEDLGPVSAVVNGASPITKDNVVITNEGVVADNTGILGADNAPKQTGFLNPEELPEQVLQIKVSNSGFEPKQFTTVSGAPTTISLTSSDNLSHNLVFSHRLLSSISIFVGPGQTKAITFQAPETPGVYDFKCLVPGHEERGEVGQMIVK